MDGTIGSDIADRDALIARVHTELLELRGQTGKLTIQKFGGRPVLRRVCGGDDLLDAFLMFEREMRRYEATAGRNEQAAAISITAPAETVLDRLEHVAAALPQDGRLRDQRTARRWSDAGLASIARDLVYMAEVQGRLGRELLRIEIGGDQRRGLNLTIDQMTLTSLEVKPPLIKAWHYRDGEPAEHALRLDPDGLESAIASDATYTMTRYHVEVELPARDETAAETGQLLSVTIEGRDAPMRSVTIADHSSLPDGYAVEFTVYRTIAVIDLIQPR